MQNEALENENEKKNLNYKYEEGKVFFASVCFRFFASLFAETQKAYSIYCQWGKKGLPDRNWYSEM